MGVMLKQSNYEVMYTTAELLTTRSCKGRKNCFSLSLETEEKKSQYEDHFLS